MNLKLEQTSVDAFVISQGVNYQECVQKCVQTVRTEKAGPQHTVATLEQQTVSEVDRRCFTSGN